MIGVRQTDVFAAWFAGLRDREARARITVRIRRLSLGNPGDVKPVGSGVSEMRIDYGPGDLLKAALGDIARAKGMTEIAQAAGLGRANLYKALSPDGNPEFATVARVLKALGLRLSVAA
jgi:probable addiction module antidote protein